MSTLSGGSGCVLNVCATLQHCNNATKSCLCRRYSRSKKLKFLLWDSATMIHSVQLSQDGSVMSG